MSPNTLSLDDLRAAREDLQRRQAARKTQFDADKAAFDAERQVFAARLADLEAAERVWQMLSGEHAQATTPNGHDHQSELANDEVAYDEIDDDAQGGYQTHKDLVLEAIQRLGSRRKGLARALSG